MSTSTSVRYAIFYNLQNVIEFATSLYQVLGQKRIECWKSVGNESLKKAVVCHWHQRFKSGRESAENDEGRSQPSTSKTNENTNKVEEILINNRKLTITDLAENLTLSMILFFYLWANNS